MVNPAPSIALDGQFLTCSPTTDADGKTVLYADRATLIGRFTVTWGRGALWKQPEPAVFTFTLWEPATLATTWLKKVANGTALRRGCWLTYNKPNFSGATYPGDKWIFRGFTTNVDVEASTQLTANGPTAGWLVQIQCAAADAFIGQEEWDSGTLPRETMQQRAVRIKNSQLYTAGCREIYFEAAYAGGYVNPYKATGKSVIDSMKQMYSSFADQWAYNPDRNVVIRIGTFTFSPYALKFGISGATAPGGDSKTVRIFPPRWTDPTGTQAEIDTRPYPAASVGACDVSGPVALSSTALNDITDLACSWHDAITNPPDGVDYTSKLNVKNSAPRNTLHFDSWYENGTAIDPILQSVKTTCQREGSRPFHPSITLDTRRAGDVQDWQTFESICLTAQTIRQIVLMGSPFSTALGFAPIWSPAGGIVAYEDGHWTITLNLQPVVQSLPGGHVPVTPNGINTSITLGDPNAWHLDESITPADLYYISNSDAGVYVYS